MPEFKKDRSKFRMKNWDSFVNNPKETPFKFGLGKFIKKAANKVGGAIKSGKLPLGPGGLLGKAVGGMLGGGGAGGAAGAAMGSAGIKAMGTATGVRGGASEAEMSAMMQKKLARQKAMGSGMGAAMIKKGKKNKY